MTIPHSSSEPVDASVATKVLPLHQNRLGELLVDLSLVSPAEMVEALRRQSRTQRRIGEILEEMGVVSHEVIDATLCIQAHREQRWSRR
jgi:hypothetical protein